MAAFIDFIAKMSTIQKVAAALLVYAGIFAFFHFVMYTRYVEDIDAQERENRELTRQYNEYSQRAENRDRFEREIDELNEAFSLALRELPDSREIPDLLRRISTIGKKIGLEFNLFQPLPEVPEGFYAQVPVRLELEGSYHEVAMFFDRIGKLNRIVNIRDITMASPVVRSGKVVLRTSGRAVTYRFLSAAEQEDSSSERRGRNR